MKVILTLTDACNLSCTYCYRLTKESHRVMPFETAVKALAFVVAEADRSGDTQISVTFFGGEPLLQPALLLQIVSYAQQHYPSYRFSFAVTTNGTLLTPAIRSQLEAQKVQIILSLDGIPEAHDANRPFRSGKGSFATIISSLEGVDCRSITIEKVIRVNTVHHTATSFKEMVDRGFVRFVMIPDFEDVWDEESFEVLRQEYASMAELYSTKRHEGTPLYLNLFDDKIQSHLSQTSFKKRACAMAHNHFAISTEGGIFPCSRFISNDETSAFCLGTVEKGMEQSRCAPFHRHYQQDKALCEPCSIKDRCLGNSCGCVSFTTTGDIFGVSPLVCEHERMVTQIADHIGAKIYG